MFESLRKNAENHKETKIFLGSLEAEAEALPTSRMPLLEVYEDFFDLANELDTQKFIITGRKGSGKSAFAEFAFLKSQTEPNLFVKFIRQAEFSLEEIIQIGKSKGITIERELLFKWIILTNILNLILSKENDVLKQYDNLKKFLKKNSGYIDLDGN